MRQHHENCMNHLLAYKSEEHVAHSAPISFPFPKAQIINANMHPQAKSQAMPPHTHQSPVLQADTRNPGPVWPRPELSIGQVLHLSGRCRRLRPHKTTRITAAAGASEVSPCLSHGKKKISRTCRYSIGMSTCCEMCVRFS